MSGGDDERSEPRRNADGTYAEGETGNPGGIPRSARRFKRKAREAANLALDRLVDELDDMDHADLIRATKLLASHGGYLTAEQSARLILAAAGLNHKLPNRRALLELVAAAHGKTLPPLDKGADDDGSEQAQPSEGDPQP